MTIGDFLFVASVDREGASSLVYKSGSKWLIDSVGGVQLAVDGVKTKNEAIKIVKDHNEFLKSTYGS